MLFVLPPIAGSAGGYLRYRIDGFLLAGSSSAAVLGYVELLLTTVWPHEIH